MEVKHCGTPKRDLTSHVGDGEAPLSRVAVGVEDQQQLVAAGGDGRQALPSAPPPQQGPVLGAAVEGSQVVVVTAARKAAPALQLHVQKEDLDPVTRRQLDAPLALEVVWVEVGVPRAGEIPFDSGEDLLALACSGRKGKGKNESKPEAPWVWMSWRMSDRLFIAKAYSAFHRTAPQPCVWLMDTHQFGEMATPKVAKVLHGQMGKSHIPRE